MKGLANGKKGFLLLYREVMDKLSISDEYFLNDLEYYGEEVILRLIKKDNFATGNDGTLDIRSVEHQERYTFIKKEELEKKLGITIKNPLFVMCFWDRNKLRWSHAMDSLLAAREMLGKENLVWIREGNPEEDYHHIEFVEMEW